MTVAVELIRAVLRVNLWLDRHARAYARRRYFRFWKQSALLLIACVGVSMWLLLLTRGGGDDDADAASPDMNDLLAQIGRRDKYRKIIGIARATTRYERARVTIATQASVEYVHHVVDLTRRWDGPIVVAVYTPGDTYMAATKTIELLRRCYPRVRAQVTFSLLYGDDQRPNRADKAKLFRLDETPCAELRFPLEVAGARQTAKYGLYPVNAARNTARETVGTDHVLVMDIELKPSAGLEQAFLSMLARHRAAPDPRWQGHSIVYVLPVFEVEDGEKIPEDKTQLVELLSAEKAVYFHKLRCGVCHKIPYYDMWTDTTYRSKDLDVFFVTKWVAPFWEPVFIGRFAFLRNSTKQQEPMYDERFKGYGSNKIQQVFEMCLMDYEFHVLDGAFLVHEAFTIYETRLKERGAIIKANYRLLVDFAGEATARYRSQDCKLQRTGEILGYFPDEQRYDPSARYT
ncbi:PREDICTED: beta-1,4-glucuronyltransferase 1-like [Priapulus caudatus]|uniref:Beta-1,4-glucuronyltransferase 1-like n=1 Tax=Priapulus caudatus TaxID=37621 RepID=A0ABM1F8V6_PRICU|nr:PREDICTED: beta-1,4-glucuronyltransferase 1-like [Priapulus caudatus]